MENMIYDIAEASDYLNERLGNHSISTLRVLQRNKNLVPFRTPTGGIYYTKYQLDDYVKGEYNVSKNELYKKDIISTEYSTNGEYSVKQVADILDVSVRTLQRYEKKGILVPFKTETSVYYTDAMLSAYVEGTYSYERQDEYRNTFIGTPIEIKFNLDRMEKLDVSDSEVQYYRLDTEFLKTKFDILEVDQRRGVLKNSFTKKYTLGRIVTENGEEVFESALSFMGR